MPDPGTTPAPPPVPLTLDERRLAAAEAQTAAINAQTAQMALMTAASTRRSSRSRRSHRAFPNLSSCSC